MSSNKDNGDKEMKNFSQMPVTAGIQERVSITAQIFEPLLGNNSTLLLVDFTAAVSLVTFSCELHISLSSEPNMNH